MKLEQAVQVAFYRRALVMLFLVALVGEVLWDSAPLLQPIELICKVVLTLVFVYFVRKITMGIGYSSTKSWIWVLCCMIPVFNVITPLIVFFRSAAALKKAGYRLSFWTNRVVVAEA